MISLRSVGSIVRSGLKPLSCDGDELFTVEDLQFYWARASAQAETMNGQIVPQENALLVLQ